VLCSTFTTSFISAFICAAVYLSGHLSTEFLRVVRKSAGARRVVGETIYYLVPNLERFNFKYHATYDVSVPSTTLLAVVLFGVAYASAALLGAVVVFQRRDFR
jgi:Cu-processing system permease protein